MTTAAPAAPVVPLQSRTLPAPRGTGRIRRLILRRLGDVGLAFVIFLLVAPFGITLSISFRPAADVNADPLGFPTRLTFDNIVKTFIQLDYGVSALNTVLLVVVSTVFSIILGSAASYPLSRITKRWTAFAYRFFILGTTIPIFVMLAPLYLLMRDLHLLNTHLGVILIYVAGNLPVSIFFFTSFMRQVPVELEEAAALDGAGPLRIFFQVIFPLLRPVTATLATFMTLGIWNDLIVPFIFLQDTGSRTVMANAYALIDPKSVDPTILFPAVLLGVAPLIVIFIILQRQVVEGLGAGAVKA